MTKQAWWAALVVAFAAMASGCSEVGKCEQGDLGCQGGPCNSGNECKFDLTCVTAANMCGKIGNGKADFGICRQGDPGCFGGGCGANNSCTGDLVCVNDDCVRAPSTGDGDGDPGDGDMTPDAGPGDGDVDAGPSCTDMCAVDDEDAVCTPDKMECVNFCKVPADGVLPGSLADMLKPKLLCKAWSLEPNFEATFPNLCKRRCEIECKRREWFCGEEGACDPAECESEAVGQACMDACAMGSDAEKLACMQKACNDMLATECGNTDCPGDAAPQCAGITCTNDSTRCGGAVFDGWCDDGDTFGTQPAGAPPNTDSNACPWGTDCADCGPRTGMDTSRNLPIGALCTYHSSCKGHRREGSPTFLPILEENEAWCVNIGMDGQPIQNLRRCVPDASGAGETCPDGYKKVPIVDANGDPIMIDGVTEMACVPLCTLPP